MFFSEILQGNKFVNFLLDLIDLMAGCRFVLLRLDQIHTNDLDFGNQLLN